MKYKSFVFICKMFILYYESFCKEKMGIKMSLMEYCRFCCFKILEIIENWGKFLIDFKYILCNVF